MAALHTVTLDAFTGNGAASRLTFDFLYPLARARNRGCALCIPMPVARLGVSDAR